MAAPRATDEARIRAQVDVFANAFRVKDVDAIMSVFAPDVVSFDLVPPLACIGAAAFRQHWETTFAHYSGRPWSTSPHRTRAGRRGH